MDLENLEYLSLVSKIVTELENHFDISDKDVAEMIIDMALNNPTFNKFKQILLEHDLEVSILEMSSYLGVLFFLKTRFNFLF
jgi:ATP-dependent RNA helicase DHX8/PRP22